MKIDDTDTGVKLRFAQLREKKRTKMIVLEPENPQNQQKKTPKTNRYSIGTVKYSGQAPEEIIAYLQDWAALKPPQSMRFSHTLAVSLFAWLDEDVRVALFGYIQRVRWDERREVGLEEMRGVISRVLVRRDGDAEALVRGERAVDPAG